jgi:hypothetical protein
LIFGLMIVTADVLEPATARDLYLALGHLREGLFPTRSAKKTKRIVGGVPPRTANLAERLVEWLHEAQHDRPS